MYKLWISATIPPNSWDLMNFRFDLTLLQFILLSGLVEVGGYGGQLPLPTPQVFKDP